ncbi:MAG: T9SS type A sorting domain-containing protein, partial [Tenuifilaceae bacterium]|nr:T9SS type A sorting domain-containing protein [Tenuifilaceae bacterium]
LRSASANGTQLAAGDAPVVVTSATGQPVFRGTLRNGALRLNVSGWQRGVYQVVVVHQGQRHAASLVVE